MQIRFLVTLKLSGIYMYIELSGLGKRRGGALELQNVMFPTMPSNAVEHHPLVRETEPIGVDL